MGVSLLGTTGGKIGDHRSAKAVIAPAAILEEKERHFAQSLQIRAVDDRAAMTLARDEAGAGQHRQMRRHGVLRNPDEARQFAGGNAFRLPR